MRHDLQDILDAYQADLSRVTEIASIRFNQAVKAKLQEWQERYPRHAFKVWEGHGMLSLDVQPKVCGEHCIEYLDGQRGAIGALGKEARAIVDAFNDSEQKVCLYATQQTSARWKTA